MKRPKSQATDMAPPPEMGAGPATDQVSAFSTEALASNMPAPHSAVVQ
jgi:hypothetical protein